MRLKSVFISEYKNLKDFSLTFETDSFLEVFVGRNGSGKSNYFEVLIIIFRHLYEFGDNDTPILFNYKIVYEVEQKQIIIEYNYVNEVLMINGKQRKTIGKTILPDNILIYYSGHNSTVANLLQNYQERFRKKIRYIDPEASRRFLGIGPGYKELLLTILLLQTDESKARQFIFDKLGIVDVSDEIKIILQRPYYADKTDYNIVNNDETDRYWKPQGSVKTFLDRLSKCIATASEEKVRPEGYFPETDSYTIYLSIKQFQSEFNGISPQQLFRSFDNLKLLKMLSEIGTVVTTTGGVGLPVSHFSDGQYQSVYIYSIIELFNDRNCITLLDEPDSFLHPEWQFDFLKQVFDITDSAARNNHVLMSSHSAATLIPHESSKINFFDIKNNQVNCYSLPKAIAIKKLSADMIKYSEQEQLLSIINAIQIENKPVLFTEGSTDPIIIKEAWQKLYEEEMPFIPFYGFSCTYLKQLLTDNRIHSEMGGLPVFALFDFDRAFDQWNGLNGEVLVNDPFKGMVKRWQEGDSYAIMLPIPDNQDIQKQVIKDFDTKETYGGDSCCEIEHLFYGQAATARYFHEEPWVGGSKVVFSSDSHKTSFAKDVVHTLDVSWFEIFRPILDFIKAKCPPV